MAKHTNKAYNGDYLVTDQRINDAPVYKMRNRDEAEDSRFAFLYIYFHNPEAKVWALQPVTPKPSERLANSEGKGDRPDTADWSDSEITVTAKPSAVISRVHNYPGRNNMARCHARVARKSSRSSTTARPLRTRPLTGRTPLPARTTN